MKIALLLLDGFEHLEAAPFIDIFGWANVTLGIDVEVHTFGLTKMVRSSFGTIVMVDHIVHDENEYYDGDEDVTGVVNAAEKYPTVDMSQYDALAIPGGFARFGFFDAGQMPQIQKLIREYNISPHYLIAICTASIVVAQTGMLKSRHATSYNHEDGRYLKQLAQMGVDVVTDKQMVWDGNILTTAGPSTAVPAAFALLEKLTDMDTVKKLREYMGYA
ncbi:MAG: DJ-1/PfpI family protein [Clostridiales Family XIII bacterium]|jgi:4-methyl-5(b-hydroxyethyl)-thiazole monophosphate biosynthesis|nr:DJ-1/PfpI family protein [Clostridiales Family XIII bacterium]